MEKYLIINWILYALLFGGFFIKFTDELPRKRSRKIMYGVLMLYCLFFSVLLFKEAFTEHKIYVKIGIYQTTFNFLILCLLSTKVIDDVIFKNKK